MFRLIDRYLFREILTPFGLTLGTLMLALLTDQLLRLVQFVINRGVDFLSIAKVFAAILPPFLVMTIPAGVLIGVIITFNRLSSDNEIIALQATGISLLRLLRPVILFSLVAFSVTFVLSHWSQPWTGRSLKGIGRTLLKSQIGLILDSGVFNEPFEDMIVYIDQIPSPTHLKGILIHDLRNPDVPVLTLADEGWVTSGLKDNVLGFQLSKGNQYRFNKADEDRTQHIKFGKYEFKVDLNPFLKRERLLQERLGPDQLRQAIEEDPENASRYRRHLGEYYKNYAFPFSCLIFGILGVPTGITFQRTGRLGGFAIGLILGTTYYFLLLLGDYLAISGMVVPRFAAWVPNLIMIGVAAVLFFNTSRRTG